MYIVTAAPTPFAGERGRDENAACGRTAPGWTWARARRESLVDARRARRDRLRGRDGGCAAARRRPCRDANHARRFPARRVLRHGCLLRLPGGRGRGAEY